MAQTVSVGELGLPQLELLKGQLDQEVEFLSSSLAQLKVVQTKFVEAKECLNVLNKGNEVRRRRPGVFPAENRVPDAANGENPTGPAGETRHETGRSGDDDAEAAAAHGSPGRGQGVTPPSSSSGGARGGGPPRSWPPQPPQIPPPVL
ncbi:prefoldin subunit 5 isoform X2 [Chiroxiphia lanceolata]|uniref:prefoldin subunit 5 isoform X2 n=1 Tax=Chiroxiphia lanceolata TaxID=296741 RepID=UPI0013CEC662|nr:prefoldin subunit 5 isoform X2 [Chiroxiphia lanceolata]